ncbi:MAG: hypothetical protein R3264_10000, partial [Anaerolineae bacterium]|nr:hypothetical protein [Anaerolineae bacterium]
PPPPPPTNTPVPPPPAPTNTPAPPPPPQNQGPIVIIELPNGDKYSLDDEVKLIITVRDSDGVKNFDWGVFAQNGTPLVDGGKDCGNSSECRTDREFKTPLEGDFQIGVEAFDSTGQKTIQISQIYVR